MKYTTMKWTWSDRAIWIAASCALFVAAFASCALFVAAFAVVFAVTWLLMWAVFG